MRGEISRPHSEWKKNCSRSQKQSLNGQDPLQPVKSKASLDSCSYYRHFVPSFAEIANPLYQLATVVLFIWTEEAEEAFKKLKLALTNPPILAYLDPSSLFILDTDASASGIGAVLSQENPVDKQGGVVAYFSRALTIAKRHYCVTWKELLGMLKFEHFHAHLYGRKFQLRTDHAALQWLLHFSGPEGQVARWIQSLQQYDFIVQQRSRQCRCPVKTTKFKRSLQILWQIGVTGAAENARPKRPTIHSTCCYTPFKPSKFSKWLVCTRAQTSPARWPRHQASTGVIREKHQQTKPTWEEIAPHSSNIRTYCAQWQSLRVFEGVLGNSSRVWCCEAAHSPEIAVERNSPTVSRYLHSWTPGTSQDPWSRTIEILLGPMLERCSGMVLQLWSLCTE